MKATEYVEKYKDKLCNDMDYESAVCDITCEFQNELHDLIDKRKAETDDACLGCMHELNQKWNATCNLLKKECGVCVLVRNGLINYWDKKYDLKLKENPRGRNKLI